MSFSKTSQSIAETVRELITQGLHDPRYEELGSAFFFGDTTHEANRRIIDLMRGSMASVKWLLANEFGIEILLIAPIWYRPLDEGGFGRQMPDNVPDAAMALRGLSAGILHIQKASPIAAAAFLIREKQIRGTIEGFISKGQRWAGHDLLGAEVKQRLSHWANLRLNNN